MDDNPASASFIAELRRALRHLYDPANLRKSPLVALFNVDPREDPPVALRRVLVGAIEALKPSTDVPPHTHAWRTYRLLLRRHVEQFSQREVATELGLSVRHVRREEAAALEMMARYLWAHYDLQARWRSLEATPAAADRNMQPGDIQTPTHEQEIAWLQASLSSEPTDVQHMIQAYLLNNWWVG